MPKTHELKILPGYLDDILCNRKTFEIRKNDRDFQVGDLLHLREYCNGRYGDRSKTVKVTYILSDFDGLAHGYVAMAIEEVEDE